jgi:hypothetical protein
MGSGELRGNTTCRLISNSFSTAFLSADYFAHLQPPSVADIEAKLAEDIDWDFAKVKLGRINEALNTLQAHIGQDPGAHLAVAADELSQGIKNKNIDRVNSAAEIIQEITLKEGLIAITQECGKKEV